MNTVRGSFAAGMALLVATATSLFSAAGIKEETLGSPGRWLAGRFSPEGVHVALLLMKGSRFAVAVDGAEGPRIDQILNAGGDPFFTNGPDLAQTMANALPVVFSDDGTHHAYFAKVGGDRLLVVDGKEVARAPITPTTAWQGLAYSRGGKLLHYLERDAAQGWRAVVNGQPGPWSREVVEIVTSPDGAHYVYNGWERNATAAPSWTVVDGRQVKYIGRNLRFTGSGAVIGVVDGQGMQALIANGKPVVQAVSVEPIWVSPYAATLAAVVVPRPGAQPVLTINGTAVAGTEGVQVVNVFFSPNGKRYAAVCRSMSGGTFLVIDGKKGLEYQAVNEDYSAQPGSTPSIGFTPDSSKFYYIAHTSQVFLVVEDDEGDGYNGSIQPVVGGGGRRMGFTINVAARDMLVLDGRAKPMPGAAALGFSPDGSRYALIADQPNRSLYVDGTKVPGLMHMAFMKTNEPAWWNPNFVFSPDSRHVACPGVSESVQGARGLYVDGVLVSRTPNYNMFRHPIFTPDSRHLYWVEPRTPDGNQDKDNAWLVLDGKQVAKFDSSGSFDRFPENWRMQPDGTLKFVAIVGDELKRLEITPPPETSIDTMLAAASGNVTPPAPAPAATSASESFKPVVQASPQKATRVTDIAESPAEAKAAAEKLTWQELAQRPELWPATVTVKVAMNFQGGVGVRAGQKVNVVHVKATEVDLVTTEGKLNFAADPEETDLLALAREGYARLTPKQRKLTYGALASGRELWPLKVKLTQSFDFGNGKGVRAGDEVTVVDFQPGRLTVKSEALNATFQVMPQATDIMPQARRFVEDESAGPRLVAVQKEADDRIKTRGRVTTELDGKLVSSVTGKPQPLDEAALPKYLVFFRGSSTCPITRGFMPSMVKYYQQEKPRHPEFELIWIETESPADTSKFARESGFSWRAVEYDSTPAIPTVNSRIDGRLPQLIVMDRDGKILANGIQNDAPSALAQLAALLK